MAFGLGKMNEKISTLEQAAIVSALPSLGVVALLGAKKKEWRVPPAPKTPERLRETRVGKRPSANVADGRILQGYVARYCFTGLTRR